jgi:hypothetical protein
VQKHVQALFIMLFLASYQSATYAQSPSDDSADTSAAQAAIKAMQQSVPAPAQSQQTFPALKAQACKIAVPYVESPSGLLGDWDQATSKSSIDRSGISAIQKVKNDLLSDTWWARSSGPDVANDVSTLCNLLIDVSAAMTPTGKAVDFAKDVSTEFGLQVKAQSVKIFEAIENGSGVMDAIQGGTANLAIMASQESLKQVGSGQFAAVIGVLKDVQTYAKNAQEGAEFKATVQEQLNRLDEMLNKYGNDDSLQRERMEAIEQIKDTVIAACNEGQPIRSVPEFASGPTDPSQNATQSFAPPPPPVVPWWMTALRTPVYVPNRPPAVQPAATVPPPLAVAPTQAWCGNHPVTANTRVCP